MTKPILNGICAGLLFAGSLIASGAAMAQQEPPAAPMRPEVKTFDDWQVRCFPIESPSPCDMFQELSSEAANQRVMSLSIAYVPGMNQHVMQIMVPLGVAIPPGLTIQGDANKSAVLKYRRCDRNGCYVERPVDSAIVESLTRASAGQVNVVIDSGKSYSIKFSLKGFAAAHDAMVAQARAKAKPVAKAGETAPAGQQ